MRDLIPPPAAPRPATLVAAVVLAALVAGCASGPETGVRSDFEQRDLQSVAVVPFYASGSFGLEDQHHRAMRQHYQRAAAEALQNQGLEVVEAGQFREQLERLEMWEQFHQGIPLRRPLTDYFDGDDDALEVRTLLQLAGRGAFNTDTLLFGEIVYHTRGTCREEAADHLPYARTILAEQTPPDAVTGCVSSHFRAKLVDVATAQTMWFNRMFLETKTDELNEQLVDQTVTSTVETTLIDEQGLTPLAPTPVDARAKSE